MSYTTEELIKRESKLPEESEADGRMLDRAYTEYMEKQALLHGLMNKTLDTAIDTNQKLYGLR